MTTNIKNSLSIHRTILLWIILLVCELEWGAYLLNIFFYFYDFYYATTRDFLSIGSFLISPLLFWLISYFCRHKIDKLIRIVQLIFPFFLLGWILLNLLYYVTFYQYFGWGSANISGFLSTPVLYGMIGSLTDSVQILFRLNLLYTFLLFVPLILVLLTQGGTKIELTNSTGWAMAIFSLYMVLRIGSFGGVPLRSALLGICIFIFWWLPISESEIELNNHDIYIISSDKQPIKKMIPIFWILAVIWGAPAFTSHGLFNDNWIWAGGVIGFILWKILSLKTTQKSINSYSKIILVCLVLIYILIVLSTLFQIFLVIRPIVLLGGLIFSFGILGIDMQGPSPSEKTWTHHLGILFLIFFTNVMLLIPYISGAMNPITELVAFILLIFGFIFSYVRLPKTRSKNNNL